MTNALITLIRKLDDELENQLVYDGVWPKIDCPPLEIRFSNGGATVAIFFAGVLVLDNSEDDLISTPHQHPYNISEIESVLRQKINSVLDLVRTARL
jgi:hypothetical protein